ncbi:hypothetical protein GE09DRAFT_746265 [Coniochaeta sp. 2T2.1]|nr:hypothetical protein GE09DRAFT_746265 [Coniochaeta sp. 2T2.1]
MPLVVRPVERSDVTQCIALRVASLGSLVIGRPPPYPGYVQEAEAAVHNDIDSRPFVHHLKVVDPEKEHEVIAYGKWEVYPGGRPDLDQLHKPMDLASREVDQYGSLREAAHNYFCAHNGEMGKRPHLSLALLATAREHRRRGAGSLIVIWGIEMSDASGLPCYLQASEEGRQLYRGHGFQDVDTVEFDLANYGLGGVESMTAMIRLPVGCGAAEAMRSI